MELSELLELAIKCAILFVCGSFTFDIVHYILHVFENSRFSFLRWIGGFHGVHHDFLDRNMQIQKKYSTRNLILHVIPEYMTAVIGMLILGLLFFGLIPALIVIGIRTVMVIIYVAQKGEDFTHAPLQRVNGVRYLFWVGPHYHALHHVYPLQYYSSFVNFFDLIFGTNCQLKDRRVLILDPERPLMKSLQQELLKAKSQIQTFSNNTQFDKEQVKSYVSQADILAVSLHEQNLEVVLQWMDTFKQEGLKRLVPPEVWVFGARALLKDSRLRGLYKDNDLSVRLISISSESIKPALFFIKRGFRTLNLPL